MDEVKAIISLKSGKEIEQQVPMTAQETEKEKEAEPESIIISEDSMKKNMHPPFPQALRSKKKNPKPCRNLGGAKASEGKYPTT